jgi:hypothetical protein
MTHERLKGWLEIAGMLAIVISLVFVGLQMRQDQSIAIAETYGSVASTSLQLSELIEGRSDLWRRGLDGEELSPEEHIDLLSLAHAVESSFVMTWSRAVQLGATSPEAVLRDYAMALHSHVGLRRYFESKIDRYKQTDAAFGIPLELGPFQREIVEQLEYLTENDVQALEPKEYVFWD